MKVFFLVLLGNIFYCQEEYIVTIPATSYYDWIYFSIEDNSTIEIQNPESSLDWDLAFQRKHIKTNSGLSGPGYGGAFVDSVGYLDVGAYMWSDEWGNINTLSDYEYEINWLEDTIHNDFYDLATHTFVEGIKNPALNTWGWFNDSYQLVPTNYVMFVKCANGNDVIKIWAYDYYQNGAGGNISLRYQTGLNISDSCEGYSGDVNIDGQINVVDVVTLVGYLLDGGILNECQEVYADMNFDGNINVVDVVNLVSLILG